MPNGGRIKVGEHTVDFQGARSDLPDERTLARFRATTGMVFQHFNLFPHMTALQNVMEGPVTVLRKPKPKPNRWPGRCWRGLLDRADYYPDKLSGGQKQRVAIARALAMQPAVMLFDEATSALHPELVGEVLNVIKGLARDGMTMILVTHEIGFAREVADEVIFMRDCIVAEFGPPRLVIDNPQQEATRSFLGRFKAAEATLAAVA